MKTYTLNNGMHIPAIGFGCYNKKGEDEKKRFMDALEAGYTLFDTASFYRNEKALGDAIKESPVPRESLCIQSKMWINEMGYDNTKAALERSLKRLQTDYLDIYLIHWPKQQEDTTPSEWKALQKETYRALEEMVKEGTIKAIGLSNFLPHHMEHIFSFCNVAPVIDQLELHLGYIQERAVSYAKEKGLLVEAWSPLSQADIFQESYFQNMADAYQVSLSQLALRFLHQYGIIPLPKASSLQHQKENLDIFRFEIAWEDFESLACLPNTLWRGEHPDIAIPKGRIDFEI